MTPPTIRLTQIERRHLLDATKALLVWVGVFVLVLAINLFVGAGWFTLLAVAFAWLHAPFLYGPLKMARGMKTLWGGLGVPKDHEVQKPLAELASLLLKRQGMTDTPGGKVRLTLINQTPDALTDRLKVDGVLTTVDAGFRTHAGPLPPLTDANKELLTRALQGLAGERRTTTQPLTLTWTMDADSQHQRIERLHRAQHLENRVHAESDTDIVLSTRHPFVRLFSQKGLMGRWEQPHPIPENTTR